jgi:hypothetical protein
MSNWHPFNENIQMNVKVLVNTYEMICVPKMLYGIELWGVKEGWQIIEGIQERLCITS